MKILLGHTHTGATFGNEWVNSWIKRLRSGGYDVEPYSLVLSDKRPVVYFDELNLMWRHRDKKLLNLYAQLKERLTEFDVFVCFNGANIHPDFVSNLPQTTVYGCFDDPESSKKLSQPVAHAFDVVMVGNIAELDTYRNWGIRQVHWWPLGFREDDYDSDLTEEKIFYFERAQNVTLLCERMTNYRIERVDKFASAFPTGAYYGRGWPAGFLPENMRIPLLQNTRIGINIHNSTGPINFRTFYLPANGVMQICDNKFNLGKIFKLGEEAIGYDSIEEAIDLTRYYLENDDERKRIAAAGWRRARSDYNEISCFKRMVDAVDNFHTYDTKRRSIQNYNFHSRDGLGGVIDKLSIDIGRIGLIGKTFIKKYHKHPIDDAKQT